MISCTSIIFIFLSRNNINGIEGGENPVVGGPKLNPQQMAAQKRLQQTQAQVDEVCFTFVFILQLKKINLYLGAGRWHYEGQRRESAGARPKAVRTG